MRVAKIKQRTRLKYALYEHVRNGGGGNRNRCLSVALRNAYYDDRDCLMFSWNIDCLFGRRHARGELVFLLNTRRALYTVQNVRAL